MLPALPIVGAAMITWPSAPELIRAPRSSVIAASAVPGLIRAVWVGAASVPFRFLYCTSGAKFAMPWFGSRKTWFEVALSLLKRFSVEASSECVFTWLPAPKTMPLLLSR